MANFLTDGRTALLDALKDDEAIAARVRTWREFGPGLRQRLAVEPAYCPLLALYPAEGDQNPRFNAANQTTHGLLLRIVTSGQNAEPCEELAALVLERIAACRAPLAGLADVGLKDIRVSSIRWDPHPAADGAHLMWEALVGVRLVWIRNL